MASPVQSSPEEQVLLIPPPVSDMTLVDKTMSPEQKLRSLVKGKLEQRQEHENLIHFAKLVEKDYKLQKGKLPLAKEIENFLRPFGFESVQKLVLFRNALRKALT